jgi:hypothetical protein
VSTIHEALDRIEGLQRQILAESRAQSLRLDNADERTRGLEQREAERDQRIARLERRGWFTLAVSVAALVGCVLAVGL